MPFSTALAWMASTSATSTEMPGAAGSSLLMMVTWAERLVGDATVTTQPRSIATSKPSKSTKNSRVSAGRSDLMLGTALLTITLRVLSHDRGTRHCGERAGIDWAGADDGEHYGVSPARIVARTEALMLPPE